MLRRFLLPPVASRPLSLLVAFCRRVSLFVALLPAALPAQHDYRNLDRGHPVATEDAYPVELRGLEFMAPASWSRSDGESEWMLEPELMWGAFRNGMVGLGAPFGLGEHGGMAGLRPFVFYNFHPGSPGLPALALRADFTLPLGALGGDGVTGALTAIATRSFGATRLHLNASAAVGSAADAPLDDALPRWSASIGVDYALWRNSVLLVADAGHSWAMDGGGGSWSGGGVRVQVTPTLVFDFGVSNRISERRITAGFTKALGGERRSDWKFLQRHRDAARLFNAFDYGHAVLYERLLALDSTAAADALESEYRFLVRDLLVRPPRFAVVEEAIAPGYAKLAWPAMAMFDRAHVLHRQIYDVYAMPELSLDQRRGMVERLTDRYLEDRARAFAPVPKSMTLMDDQPFSQRFRQEHPVFNGLIWAYHWLQVGLYDPLIEGVTRQEQERGVAATVEHFGQMIADPANQPATMPMTAAVSPRFAQLHPRAAAIFDNLHMMHDIISDVLANPDWSRERKREEILRQLEEMRDETRNLMGPGHHHP
ncbi:MAG TPA: hypothetical protein PLL69_06330 [Gemmatimonadales bacterium]|nr:hypothetical protein [Gemmatimonadales bacterium]